MRAIIIRSCLKTALEYYRSVKFRMNLGGHRFSQNTNQKISRFLPYQTNKDHSTVFGDLLVSVGSFFGYDPWLFGRADIWKTFGLGETMTS